MPAIPSSEDGTTQIRDLAVAASQDTSVRNNHSSKSDVLTDGKFIPQNEINNPYPLDKTH